MTASTTITITNDVGLHARPATLFVQTAGKFQSELHVSNRTTASDAVNAKSILSVLTLGVIQGMEIEVTAEGEDEQAAIEAIQALAASNFGEA